MHRIDTSTKAPDLFGAGKHGFRDGDPQQAIGATRLNAAFFNAMQEELARICEAANVTLDAGNHEQVLAALRALFLDKTGTAADSAKLGGKSPEYYAKASDLAASGSKPGRLVVTFRDTPEPGTLVCNGAAVSRTAYAALFAAIGTKYGAGDGSTTFNLPNIPDGHALLAASGSAVGSTSNGEVKSHNHTATGTADTQGNHNHAVYYNGGGGSPTGFGGPASGASGSSVTAHSGSHTHNISIAINATGPTANLAAGMKLLVCIAYE